MEKSVRIILGIAAFMIFLTFTVGFIVSSLIVVKAHKTFDGYCHWRGLEVVNKSADYGYCKSTVSGREYKIVLFKNKWYLDGDLPWAPWG